MTTKIDLDEAEAIQAYDEAKASNDDSIPFTQAIKEIEGEACVESNWGRHSVLHAESVK